MSRGILWMVWGDYNRDALRRSQASAKHWHPELEQHVETLPADSTLLVKSRIYELSPFDETLFLDADTTVMGDLSYGFYQADMCGIACCINLNPWARRYHHLRLNEDDVEYSSGVVFFSKQWQESGYDGEGNSFDRSVKRVFEHWNRFNFLDTSCAFLAHDGKVKEQPHNDQALFTLAIHQTGLNPFVLPLNWNLYSKWQRYFWGEIKIWHGYEDIPATMAQWNESQSGSLIKFGRLP